MIFSAVVKHIPQSAVILVRQEAYMEQVNRRMVSDVIIINNCKTFGSLQIQAYRCNKQND